MKNWILAASFQITALLCNAQNVGIGTDSPSEKLHVSGNVKADTVKPNAIKLLPNAAYGKVLTSDSSGNGSWQENKSGNVGFGSWGDCATNSNLSEFNPVADSSLVAGDDFGSSVSMSGNFAIVGIDGSNVGANFGQGSANIYRFNGTKWEFTQKLTDPSGIVNSHFGTSVFMSGNYVIVGSPNESIIGINQGAACIYQYNGTNWVFMQKITDPAGASGDFFGGAVSLSGSNAIVSSMVDDVGTNTDQGSACIFSFNGTSWIFVQKLTEPTGTAGSYFGTSVSISGNTAIMGAYLGNGSVSYQGSASMFKYNGSSWAFLQKLTDPAGEAGDEFGRSVSIAGNYALVGVASDKLGVNYGQGSVRIYKYSGSSWTILQTISDPAGQSYDFFGFSVCISGDYIMISARGKDVGTVADCGSVAIYYRMGMGWQKLQNFSDPGAAQNDAFGTAVSIDGSARRFLIGASGYIQNSGKAVFGKLN